jgi:hypothetical protein
VRMRALVTSDGALRVDVTRAYALLATRRVTGGVLELTGELRGGHEPRLELRRRSDGRTHAYDVARPRDGFRARVPLGDLVAAPPSVEAVVTGGPGAPEMWDVTVAGLPLGLPDALDGISWAAGEHEVALTRTRSGDMALVTRKVVAPIVLEPREREIAARSSSVS